MIERLSSRIHFAVFAPDLSYSDGFPLATEAAFLKEHVSGGKTLAAFRIALPLTGGFDDLAEYTVRLARYLPDGSRDRTFGANGRLDVGNTLQVRIVPGSRILVVPEFSQAIRSYSLNGRVDTTFGGDGEIAMPTVLKVGGNVVNGGGEIASVLDNGQILVQANVDIVGKDILHQYSITRLNRGGSIDPTFGRNGYVTFRKNGTVHTLVTPHAIYIHADFGYGTTPASGEIIKLALDGKTADTNFDQDGVLPITAFASSITEQPDGMLLYIDSTFGKDPTLYRLNTDGTPDSTFSADGKVTMTYADSSGDGSYVSNGVSLRLDGQNRIVGSANGSIYRFSSGGALDSYPFNGTAPFASSIASVDDQGNVITTDGKRYGLTPPQQLDAKGIVQVATDSGDETVTVSDAGRGKIRVVVNGDSRLFRARDVRGFNLQLFDGDIDLHVAVNLPVTLKAGNGNDVIGMASGDDDIKIGTGNHTVDLGGGNDKAEIGDSLKSVATDRYTVTGSGGNKTIQILSGSANITLPAGDHGIEALGNTQTMPVVIAGGNNRLYLAGELNVATVGGSGKNDVTAFGAHDVVVTGDGPDTVLAISSQGTFRTNGGDDVVTIRNFSEAPTTGSTVYAGAGDDHVFCDQTYQSLATVYGGDGDDRLEGWTQSQRLYGEAGRDTVNGNDGNDYLFGGDGDDVINGGASSDRIYGEAGNDRLYGSYGNDKLYGGIGNDRLVAQLGNYELFGDEGNDRLYADASAGRFVLHGGADNDLFFTRNGRRDTLYGDGGDDVADADANDVLNGVTRPAVV